MKKTNMSIFPSLIKKEALHLLRDRQTMLVVIVMPVILLLLFGFAISMEVNNIRVVAVVSQHDDRTRDIITRLASNPYFIFEKTTDINDARDMLRRGETDVAVVLRPDKGELKSQIITDASNTAMAQSVTAYVQGVIGGETQSPVLTMTLYNPQLKSSYNFVPGIMGMIFILICAIMTSVSIVSEKEKGTMDLLLVSPVSPRTIIFGKLVPYFLLSCIILALMLVMSYTLLEIPLSTAIFNVVWVTVLYVVLSLSLGLLISTLVDTQLAALIISAIVCMIPIIMFSGMIFPIDNMPEALQWFSCIIPARWYVAAMRKLMIQQLPVTYIFQEVIILAVMTLLIITVAIKKFNKSK